MPYVAFHLRMQAAARRQLTVIGALRAAEGGPAMQEYMDSLHRAAGVPEPKRVFALVQSDD